MHEWELDHVHKRLLFSIYNITRAFNANPSLHSTSHMIAIYRNNYSNIDPHSHTHLVVREEVRYDNLAVEVAELHCIDFEPVEVVR